MTDRELLEFAAKAAGMEVAKGVRDPLSRVWANGKVWNPLADDGDALRLAVKLDFYVGPRSTEAWRDGREVLSIFEDGEDTYAATRRAIVRAAAEIGKKSPTLAN